MVDGGNSIGSSTQEAAEAAKQRSWPAIKSGAKTAQARLGDGMDLVKGASKSLSGFVEEQPLLAIAGAFVVGYMAAWMLRKISS